MAVCCCSLAGTSACKTCANNSDAFAPTEGYTNIGAYRKPKTNADRIRGMSDEELAEFLNDVSKSWYDEGYTKDDESPLMSGYPSTADKWLGWLRSPASEEEDG